MSNLHEGKKYLITCDSWFIGPDGNQYRAVYGTVNKIMDDKDTMGIKTNRGSTNWYVSIGNMLIAGCQIHYSIESDITPPDRVEHKEFNKQTGKVDTYRLPSSIYIAD